jgi:hypothetical protein
MADLVRARKYQFAAFIADTSLLVVWDDDALNVVHRAKSIENELMQLVWRVGQEEDEAEKEAKAIASTNIVEIVDEESGEVGYRDRRPTNLQNTILVSVTLIIITSMLGAGYRQLAIETAVDGNYLRMAFVLLTPVQVFFTLVRPYFNLAEYMLTKE